MIVVKNNSDIFKRLKKQDCFAVDQTIIETRKFNEHLINGIIDCDFINVNFININWNYLSMNKNIAYDVINKYLDKIIWKNVALFGRCDEEFVNKYFNYLSVNEILFSNRYFLSDDFIEDKLVNKEAEITVFECDSFKRLKVGLLKDKSFYNFVLVYGQNYKKMIAKEEFNSLNCGVKY